VYQYNVEVPFERITINIAGIIPESKMGMYSFRLPWSISQTGGRFIPNQEA
jgi:hypothetical protein